MTELQKELDQAFRLLGSIPVSGDCVDLMAGARERLRRAYALAEAEKPEEAKSDG